MKPRPYIGVTGAAFLQEVTSTAEKFREMHAIFRPSDVPDFVDHVPMIGILVSYKTLLNQTTQNRRYPPFKTVPALLEAGAPETFMTIHYNTKEQDTLYEQVHLIFKGICPEHFPYGIGLQLNMDWPSLFEVNKIKKEYPYLNIIFQANEKVIGSDSPSRVAGRIARYEQCIDYVLIDPSGGKAKQFLVEDALETYGALDDALPGVMIGFAGGLGPNTVSERVGSIKRATKTSAFSIDAEGNVRDKLSDRYGDDLFNQDKVTKYIKESYIEFSK